MGLHLRTRETGAAGPAGPEPPSGYRSLVDWQASLRRASRACCCPGRPAVVVIMPPGPGRPDPVDLLLCAHHYRVSERTLAAAGAAVFGTSGEPVSEDPFQLAGPGA